MRIKTTILALTALLTGGQAWATGEVLKVDTYGWQYCDNAAPLRLTPDNAQPFWIHIDSATSATVYLDAALTQPAFPIETHLSPIPTTPPVNPKASVIGHFFQDSENYLTVNGVATFNNAGSKLNVLRIRYIRSGLMNACSSSGNMIAKRIN